MTKKNKEEEKKKKEEEDKAIAWLKGQEVARGQFIPEAYKRFWKEQERKELKEELERAREELRAKSPIKEVKEKGNEEKKEG